MAVYRIPNKRWYRMHNHTGLPWAQVYGNKRCSKCKLHFEEGQAYMEDEKVPGHYHHVECPTIAKLRESCGVKPDGGRDEFESF